MGQKNEKLRRQVEALRADVAQLGETQRATEKLYAALLDTVSRNNTDRIAAERRAARRAQREAHRQRLNAVLALILAAVVCCAALIVTAQADAGGTPSEAVEPPSHRELLLDAALAAADVDHPAQEPENELIEATLLSRATKLDNVTVTHYDVCLKCCSKLDGITASGVQAVPGVTVAVDPAVIPLGSDVLVDYGDGEIHHYRADDTVGAIKGSHIDLCVSSHEEALQLSVRTATVYWVAQEVG